MNRKPGSGEHDKGLKTSYIELGEIYTPKRVGDIPS